MPKPLSWDDFHLIRAIAEAGSLPEAARRLGIDHSTVFRRLRQVEEMLGQPLFERHRTGLAATAAGEELLAAAARMDQDATDALRRLAGQAPSPAGELRISTSDALLCRLLFPVLARFRAAHPRIRLELVIGNEPLNLSRRDADIAFRAAESAPETLVGRRLARIGWALYGRAKALPPAGRDPAQDADWVGPDDSLAALPAARRLRADIPPARVACRADSILAIAEAIEAGLGIGHLPCFEGDGRPALRRLGPVEPGLGADLWLLTHPDLRQAPRVRAFMDFVAPAIAALRRTIEGEAGTPFAIAPGAPSEGRR